MDKYNLEIYKHYSEHYNCLFDLSDIYDKLDYHELTDTLPDNKDIAIADLGCGQGQLLYYLHKKGFVNLTGVDLSASQLETARKWLPDNVKLLQENIIDFLAKKRKKFDAIILYDIVEHIKKEDIMPFLSSIDKALKDSGRIIIRTPNMASPLGIYSRYICVTHEIAFTEHSLREILIATGFNKIKFIPFRPASLKIRLIRRLYHFLLKIIFKIEYRSVPKILDANLLVCAER